MVLCKALFFPDHIRSTLDPIFIIRLLLSNLLNSNIINNICEEYDSLVCHHFGQSYMSMGIIRSNSALYHQTCVKKTDLNCSSVFRVNLCVWYVISAVYYYRGNYVGEYPFIPGAACSSCGRGEGCVQGLCSGKYRDPLHISI